jgi:hypothetical protein
MICCTICGLTKLNHQHKHFKKLNSMYNNLNTNEFGCTFYGITNHLSSDYTTTSNGKEMCVCVCVCVCVNIHFIYNYYLFKILDYIYKNEIGVLAQVK